MNNEQNGLFANERMKRTVALTLLIFAVFLITKTMTEFKEYRFIGVGVPATNTITVSGEGEVFAIPDIATFSFSVVEEKANAKGAQEVATEKINMMLRFLRDNDVEDKDIKTTGYNVYPRYEYKQKACNEFRCPPGERVLRGFEVNQTIQVKVRNIDNAGEILLGIGSLGVSNVSGLTFTIDDEDGLNLDARKAAINDAQQKAKELSKDLGVKLVRVVNFSESSGQPYYARFGFAEATVMDDSAVGAPAPEIPIGENKIISNVSITYEIR